MLNHQTFVASADQALLDPLAMATDPSDTINTSVVKEVAERCERLRVLMIMPERSALEDVFSPDLSFGHSDGRVQTRDEYVAGLLAGKSVFKSIAITLQTINVIGDIAIVRHRFDADAVSNGIPKKPHIGILLVWRKTEDVWRLLARQAHA